MGTRGRKSAGELMTASPVTTIRRPDPPLDLAPEEADVWIATVEALPADWFPRETWPLLTQWCRHTVSARRVSQLLDAEMCRDEIDHASLGQLLAFQARETAALKAMAAAMRLSQQASYSARGAGGQKSRRVSSPRPWE
jgi:hypothetical protein